MESEGEAIFYITKDEFVKRMLKMNTDWTGLATKYAFQMENAKKDKDVKWFQHEMESLTDDIRHNNEMVARARIEEGYNLFWVNMEGNLLMRRCSKEEHETMYKPRKNSSYVV